MDYFYPGKHFQNTITVLAASILNENLISSDIETTLLASEWRLRQVQSWREIGVLFSTERDPNRLENRVRDSHSSLTGGKSDVPQPNRGYQNRPVRLPSILENLKGLNEEQRTAVKELLQEFQNLFSASDSDVGRGNMTQHRINTGNHPPIKQYPR
ncbi:hypothetical protein AVEN_262696-1 [Araneus ventricosus]|uniref:Uncharacterized protein n=1 Tax=Araneus ventricosus TaxID=182803 RepID=A0A4Y2HES6_ARAVE|nr:hypothetical protein AVEN_262696-1 [Araneus ventricosus]